MCSALQRIKSDGWLLITAAVALLSGSSCMFCGGEPAIARSNEAISQYQDLNNGSSDAEQINAFTVRNFSKSREKQITFTNATLVIRLLTPLNSQISQVGDEVRAEVVESASKSGRWWLPPGTVLTGCIERADTSTYCRTNARLYLRFYKGQIAGKAFDLNTAPQTGDTAAHPINKPLTTKAKIRNVLMAASFIAIPLAMGTGGTSVAISAGAGAVLGGLLADDGKHVQGAINGAWEGSGLGVLDPVVKKGKPVVLPVNTKMALQLREPAEVPLSVVKMAHREQDIANGDLRTTTDLNTSVKIVKPVNVQQVVQRCDQLLAQKDLASAMALIDRTLETMPGNQALTETKQRLLEEVTGTGVKQ